MQRQILISVDDYETRVAVIENTKLAEYFFERREERRIVGNIYKGIVTAIIPGIEAAFIDIGLPRNAFLYVNDLYPRYEDFEYLSEDDSDLESDDSQEEEGESELPSLTIQDLLKEQQQILVQLHKEPIGAKGSRVTTNISLAGRYLVLLPCTRHIGISRRIENEEERERLKNLATELLPEKMGAIVRTAGNGTEKEEFKKDMEFLIAEWQKIKSKSEQCAAPALVFQNPSIVFRMIRDMISDGIEDIVVDDAKLYSEVLSFMKELAPYSAHKVTFYDDSSPVFRAYGVETEISALRSKKVWLNCGGYIIIDETEAMTVIDVNTGRYIGKHNLEETVYRTNLEAATEIARQLRLRDIGGIIIIDFIDMRSKENQDGLIEHFLDLLKRDRSRSHIYPLTELGLLQMTRKRVRKSLNKSVTQPCPYCKREGYILSMETMIIKIFRTFEEICREEGAKNVTLRVHPRLAVKINEERQKQLESLQERFNAVLKIMPSNDLHFEQIVEEIA
ncbi:MAG: Rne/Rng family ribonuclease [Candidatus Omnitrophota bacterium]|jgi:ribonuclease G|nr:MAG: Rne/Rng family ribonuclease [Candidatus Omnitrophota bacterium]